MGNRTVSTLGYSIIYNSLNNVRLPSAGQRFTFSQDVAGIPIGIKFVTTRANYDYFTPLFGTGFVLNLGAEGGYAFGYGGQDVNLTNRFFLGQPQFRGFNIRGIGPRVLRRPLGLDGSVVQDRRQALHLGPRVLRGLGAHAHRQLDAQPVACERVAERRD